MLGSLHILVTLFLFFLHISCVIFFTLNFRRACLAFQNVNKDYVIFWYFGNFVTKTEEKQKMEQKKFNVRFTSPMNLHLDQLMMSQCW